MQLQAELKGHARQSNYAAKYGETLTVAWAICNLSAQYRYARFALCGGVENVFNRLYATYADWNNIPQKGRNLYFNLSYEL